MNWLGAGRESKLHVGRQFVVGNVRNQFPQRWKLPNILANSSVPVCRRRHPGYWGMNEGMADKPSACPRGCPLSLHQRSRSHPALTWAHAHFVDQRDGSPQGRRSLAPVDLLNSNKLAMNRTKDNIAVTTKSKLTPIATLRGQAAHSRCTAKDWNQPRADRLSSQPSTRSGRNRSPAICSPRAR